MKQPDSLDVGTKMDVVCHRLERMQERDISRADVKNGIATGEIIEEYPEDYPNPSCLIFGYTVNNRILHIVAGCDNINIYIMIFDRFLIFSLLIIFSVFKLTLSFCITKSCLCDSEYIL